MSANEITPLGGIPVLVSSLLPLVPSDGEVARRIVRHGYADVLAWLGEEVGPKPTDKTHVIAAFDGRQRVLFVSPECHARLREASR